jgi:hypothetical protein
LLGCGDTFINTDPPVPPDLVKHKGYCFVGAVNLDLVIFSKSLLLVN